jgi:oligopeptide/dipeptide ABC transporter ATP-binding protein
MNMPVLELRGLSKAFHPPRAPALRAVDDVSLHVNRAECIALVGESGSGKSTLARLALQLIVADSGDALLQGRSLAALSPTELRVARLSMQPIFQDPAAAFNPRRTVAAILRQGLAQLGPRVAGDEPLMALLERVELRPAHDFLGRYPHELSGGQRQRLAIARAISTRPAVIIADEPLSGADVSIRAQILNLLIDLQREFGVAYILVTHDMLVARAFSHRVAVMYRGRIVEEGPTANVLSAPRHPYTQSLLAAVQSLDRPWEASPPVRKEERGPAGNGCAFFNRCPRSGQRCVDDTPELREIATGHRVACHFAAAQY